MNAKELFRKELNPADGWNEQTISFDFNDVTEFAERYLKYKLKELGIDVVVGRSEQLVCDDCNSNNIKDTDYGKQCGECFKYI